MATIKRGRKPKEETAEPAIETPKETMVAPEPKAEPIVTEQPKTKAEPVIRVLESRAIPKTMPVQQRVANGNVLVCDRKSGKCVSMASGYANQFVKRNKNCYIKK